MTNLATKIKSWTDNKNQSNQPNNENNFLELTADEFTCFRNHFKELAYAKQLTASDIVLNNIVRGKEVYHGFTPVKNRNKRINGMHPYCQLMTAVWSIQYRSKWRQADLINRFGEFLSKDRFEILSNKMKEMKDEVACKHVD